MVENYYYQTEINHWGPIVNIKIKIVSQSPWIPRKLTIGNLTFPKYTENTDFKSIVRTFTENEIDSIVKKLKKLKLHLLNMDK